MLNKVKTLKGYKLDSLDGEIGSVKEFYFDDQHWAVRYLVADTGSWLPGRQVLISPYALGAVNPRKQSISINLTNKQIEESPSLVRIPVEVVQRFHGKRSKIPFDVVQDSVGKRSSFSMLTESWTTCRNRGSHPTELGAV
jgi:hypothetical protein